MAKTQGPHHAPDEPKSRALVLAGEGYSNVHVGEMIGVPERTVRRWVSRGREVAVNQENPLIQADWVRIVRRSQGHMHSYLDYLDDHPEEIPKNAMTLNVYAGTGTDKLQKESAPSQVTQVQINFISTQRPPDEE